MCYLSLLPSLYLLFHFFSSIFSLFFPLIYSFLLFCLFLLFIYFDYFFTEFLFFHFFSHICLLTSSLAISLVFLPLNTSSSLPLIFLFYSSIFSSRSTVNFLLRSRHPAELVYIILLSYELTNFLFESSFFAPTPSHFTANCFIALFFKPFFLVLLQAHFGEKFVTSVPLKSCHSFSASFCSELPSLPEPSRARPVP